MKIFITGIAGFLGSHLADRMISLGHTVVGNDNLIGGYIDNIPSSATFYNIDCCDQNSMVNILKEVDIVCHTAATAHENFSLFSPYFITKNVFEATVSTISAAIQNKVKRFIYCSSMGRYGIQQIPYTENLSPRPLDPYAISKVAGEDILKSLADMNNMEWNIAIPHNIIGPRQNYTDPYRNVVSIMINRILLGKPPIIYGDGSQTRCFSYINDCIYCLEKLTLDPNIVNQIVNIGPDEELTSIKQVAELICSELNYSGEILYLPDRPKEVKFAYCSSNIAREILGYKTTTNLIDSIKHTIKYIQKRGPKPFEYNKVPLEIINQHIPKTWSDRLM